MLFPTISCLHQVPIKQKCIEIEIKHHFFFQQWTNLCVLDSKFLQQFDNSSQTIDVQYLWFKYMKFIKIITNCYQICQYNDCGLGLSLTEIPVHTPHSQLIDLVHSCHTGHPCSTQFGLKLWDSVAQQCTQHILLPTILLQKNNASTCIYYHNLKVCKVCKEESFNKQTCFLTMQLPLLLVPPLRFAVPFLSFL